MAYWWVNHKQTRDYEVQGDYLWSPKANQNGARNQSYDNMVLARQGDVVFSYADGLIAAVGVVLDEATTAPKPLEFGNTGTYWSNEGWFLPVGFQSAAQVIRPKDHLGVIAPQLPGIYSPIRQDGNGNQGIYLAAIPDGLGRTLMYLSQTVWKLSDSQQESEVLGVAELQDIERLNKLPNLPETQREQLVRARVGQGIFRALVLLRDPVCRVTGVAEKRFLRASHIKPWRESDNIERLDGNNGIMLSPHVDALFDLGFMSFEDNGRIIIRKDLDKEVLRKWSIRADSSAKPFSQSQRKYLALHRDKVEKIGAYRY